MQEDSLLAQFDSQESWAHARRAVLVQRVVCALKGCAVDLIPFEEVRSRLHLTQKYCRGLQTIELSRIRGSVGRYGDFTSAFLPRRSHLRQRWERVERVLRDQGMPPIELYQVGEAYFVADGNHRVSIARQQGMKTIEAYVCEFDTPVALSPEADLDEVMVASEYAEFLARTRLDRVRPEREIVFTTPGHYRELECLIAGHRDGLEETRGERVSYEEAVLSWFDEVYTPAVREISESGVLERFPGRTEADLFAWMWKHRHRLEARYAPGSVRKGLAALSSLPRWPWSSTNRE